MKHWHWWRRCTRHADCRTCRCGAIEQRDLHGRWTRVHE